MRNKSVADRRESENRGRDEKVKRILRIISAFLVVLVIANLVLFVMGFVNETAFWFIIIMTAVLAYLVIPRLTSVKNR